MGHSFKIMHLSFTEKQSHFLSVSPQLCCSTKVSGMTVRL